MEPARQHHPAEQMGSDTIVVIESARASMAQSEKTLT